MLGRAHLDRSNGDREAILGSVLVYWPDDVESRTWWGGGVFVGVKAEGSV